MQTFLLVFMSCKRHNQRIEFRKVTRENKKKQQKKQQYITWVEL